MAYFPQKRIYLLVDGRYLNVYRGDTFLLEHTRDIFQLPAIDSFAPAKDGAAWFLNVGSSPSNDKLGWFDSDFNGNSSGYSIGDTTYGAIASEGASSDGAVLLLGSGRVGVFDKDQLLVDVLDTEEGYTQAGMSPNHPGFYSFENEREVVTWNIVGIEQSRVAVSSDPNITFQFSSLDNLVRDSANGDFFLTANVYDTGVFKERAAVRMNANGVRIYYVVIPSNASAVQRVGKFLYYDADNANTSALVPVILNAASGARRTDLEAAVTSTGVVNQVQFEGDSQEVVYFQGQVVAGGANKLFRLNLSSAAVTEVVPPAGAALVTNPELKAGDGWMSYLAEEGGVTKRFFIAEGEASGAVRAETIAGSPTVEFISFGVPSYAEVKNYCNATPFWRAFFKTEELDVALGGLCVDAAVDFAGVSSVTADGTTEPASTTQTFDYSAQTGTDGRFLLVRPDETKVHLADLLGLSNSTMYQYTMSPAGNLSGATYDSVTFDAGWWYSVPEGAKFGDGGNLLFLSDNTPSIIALSGLPAAYDLGVDSSTLTSDYGGLNSVTGLSSPGALRGFVFNAAGTRMVGIGASSEEIYAVDFATAWTPSSGITYVGGFNATLFGNVSAACGTSDGLTFYVATDNSGTDTISKFTMTTPFDPTTAVADGTLDVSADGDTLWGLDISGDDATLYLLFKGSQTVVSMPAF